MPLFLPDFLAVVVYMVSVGPAIQGRDGIEMMCEEVCAAHLLPSLVTQSFTHASDGDPRTAFLASVWWACCAMFCSHQLYSLLPYLRLNTYLQCNPPCFLLQATLPSCNIIARR